MRLRGFQILKVISCLSSYEFYIRQTFDMDFRKIQFLDFRLKTGVKDDIFGS